MARYIPSLPIEDCYGSVGDVTFYHRDGKCFYKDRIRPDFPGTMRQMEQQQVHLRAIAAWQGLPSSVQKEWNAISPDVIVHRPPFDGMAHMSGYNLFVSAYHGFATLGDEHVPEPTPWVDFPAIVLELVEEVSAASGSLVIRMKAYLEECAMAEHCRFLMRLQLVKPGLRLHAQGIRWSHSSSKIMCPFSVLTCRSTQCTAGICSWTPKRGIGISGNRRLSK